MPRSVYGWLAAICLAACLIIPVCHFSGRIDADEYRNLLAAVSLCWFIFATAWACKGSTAGKHR